MTFAIIQRKHPDPGIEELIAQALTSRDQLLILAKSDVAAVRSLSRDHTGEAIIEATRIPLAILKLAHAGSLSARHPARSLLSQAEPDFGTAEALFLACQHSTQLIIAANLPHVREPERTELIGELRNVTETS